MRGSGCANYKQNSYILADSDRFLSTINTRRESYIYMLKKKREGREGQEKRTLTKWFEACRCHVDMSGTSDRN
jgi:hypothetical protein